MKLSARFLCAASLALLVSCHQETGVEEAVPQELETGVDEGSFVPDVVYGYDDTAFINPERGMYLTNVYYFRDGKVPPAASVAAMRKLRDSNMSLTFSQFYLMDFLESELSDAVLKTIQTDFANHRKAGLKTIVRFCYDYTGTEGRSPKEPEVELVLRHIEQVAPLLGEYSDIIYVLQAGFIGSWGEWSISTHFSKDSDRSRVVDALLAALPKDRQIQLRTPAFKRRVFGTKVRDTITVATAFDGSDLSRVGGHNDCFLANGSDAGTYADEADKLQWEHDTRYTIMGGETCIPDRTYCNCERGIRSLERFHWSYLNSAYNTKCLDIFRDEGCLEEVYKRLGYRLYLEKASFGDDLRPGGVIDLKLMVCNDGFASLMNPRQVEIVLRKHGSSAPLQIYSLDVDPRRVFSGSKALWQERLRLPLSVKSGEMYDVLLNLPDPAPALYGNPDFSVRLANTDVWEVSTGYNHIHTFTVK